MSFECLYNIVNLEQISHIAVVFPLLTLNKYAGWVGFILVEE